MANQEFSGYVSDFAGTVKSNSADILATTKDLEKLLTDTLDFLTDEEKLKEIVTGIRTAFNTLQTELESGELFSTQAIERQFDEILGQINKSIGIDLSKALDPKNILQSIKDLIPEDVFPEELKAIYQKIKEFFDNIDLSDVQVSVKSVNTPVPKPGSGTANDPSLDSFALPSNFDVFGPPPAGRPTAANTRPQATKKETESLFERISEEITNKFIVKESLIVRLLDKFEKAIIESGFSNELEEKRESFIKTLSSGKLSIKKILTAISELVSGLAASAIKTILNLLDLFIQDLKEILQTIKALLTIGTGSLVEALFEQFGVQDFRPTILSLPSFLISVPYTLLSKAVTGSRPEFPNIFQNTSADTNNKVYGSMQIVKSIGPFIALASDQMQKPDPTIGSSIVGLIADIYGPILDIVGQAYSEPLNPEIKDSQGDTIHPENRDHFGYHIWNYQWFYNVAWGIAVAILDGVFAIIELKAKASAKLNKWQKHLKRMKAFQDFILPSFQVAFELAHFIMFAVLYDKEKKAEEAIKNAPDGEKEAVANQKVPVNDSRARNGYMLDAIPGIVGGIISIAKAVINRKLEVRKNIEKSGVARASEVKAAIDLDFQILNNQVLHMKNTLLSDYQLKSLRTKFEDNIKTLAQITEIWKPTKELVNSISASLNRVKGQLKSGNSNAIQKQIKILKSWNSDVNFPKFLINNGEEGIKRDFSEIKGVLERIQNILVTIIQNAEILLPINQSEIKKLERLNISLTAGDIIVTLAFQLAYGSLYVNTGVDPAPST